MNPDKRIIIDDLTARVNASPFLIVVDYTSITVPEFTNLRSALAACGAQCHVAKNNFMRTALTDAGLPDIGEHLVGQTAFVTGASDVAGAAKAINTFAKASKKAEYKVAILDGAILSADEIRAIGELPPRDQLLAKLLGTINAAGSALARVIQAYVDKENGGSAGGSYGSSGGNAPLFFQKLDEVGSFQDGKGAEFFSDFVNISHCIVF